MKGAAALLCLESAALAFAASDSGRPRGVSPDCTCNPMDGRTKPSYLDTTADQTRQSPNTTKTPRHSRASATLPSAYQRSESTTTTAIAPTAPTSLELRLAHTSRLYRLRRLRTLLGTLSTTLLLYPASTARTRATCRLTCPLPASTTASATMNCAAMEARSMITLVE
jgi:hypothetical protein